MQIKGLRKKKGFPFGGTSNGDLPETHSHDFLQKVRVIVVIGLIESGGKQQLKTTPMPVDSQGKNDSKKNLGLPKEIVQLH
jgi:hypothetical protein